MATPTGFTGEVDARFTVAGKANGGYLLAMLGRAATQVAEHPHVIAVSAHFLRSPDPGAVSIDAEVLYSGRTANHVRTRLSQDGHTCVEALLTIGHLRDAEPYWQGSLPQPGTVAFDDCIRLRPDPAVFPVPMLEQVDVRLEPATLGWTKGAPTGAGELRGWLDLAEPLDPAALLFAVDALPPATFDIELTGWVPTLQLSAYVRGLPAPGPVRVLQRAHLIGDHRVDEACFVWDSTGRLVAQATQLAGIRLG